MKGLERGTELFSLCGCVRAHARVCTCVCACVDVYNQPGLCKKSTIGGVLQESARNRIFHWESCAS